MLQLAKKVTFNYSSLKNSIFFYDDEASASAKPNEDDEFRVDPVQIDVS